MLESAHTRAIVTILSFLFWVPACVTAAGRTQKAGLSCSPKTLKSGDTLILRFRMPHPKELAILAPDRRVWYFLVYQPSESTPMPIIDKARFAGMHELRLPVSTARGVPWVAGKNSSEIIFQQAGKYEVVLTDILETEGLPSFRCTVRFEKRH